MRRLGPLGPFVICGLAAAVLATPAQARHFSLRDLIGRPAGPERFQRPGPTTAVYDPDRGDRFVFDRSVNPPLMRFESSAEIWVLQPQPGPRGDMIYKDDLGEPMLRATRLGGLTLFTTDEPEGIAAALDGEAPPLKPPVITKLLDLQQHLAQASYRASRAEQRLVEFEAPDVTPESATIIADAGMVASEAIVAASKRSDLRHFLDKLDKVVLMPARKPGVKYKDGVLEIDLATGLGLPGRPSSRKIEAAFAH
jgi:hypothetical protein